MRLILPYFLFFIFASVSKAQQPNYLYSEITVKEGLAQVTVNFVQQDKKGFMWFGGNTIIQRYDGHRFKNFMIGKNMKIPGTNLQGMQYDSVKNRLWLLTGNKELGYLDADKLTYHPVKIVTPPGYENIWFALQLNKEGEVILIYVDKGITTYNEEANEVAAKYNEFTLPSGWEPRHVWQDEFRNFWIGTRIGLLKYNRAKKLMSYRGHNEENDPVINHFASRNIPTFIYTYNNMRWVFFDVESGHELYSYDENTNEVKEWHPVVRKALNGKYHVIYGVVHFKDGTIWLAGVNLFAQINYKEHSLSLVKPEASGANSIRYDDALNLYQDREKSIWVCTNKGLFRFNPSAHLFNTITNSSISDEKTYNNSVTGLLETNDGEILASTWGAGIFSYDRSFKPVSSRYITRNKPVDPGMAWCLLQTKNGDLWHGYQNGRLGITNAVTRNTTWLNPEPLNNKTIRQLAEDKNGNVWLGSHTGRVVKWEKSTNTFKLIHEFKRAVNRMYIDSRNKLWVCTDNDGVHCLDTDKAKIINSYTENDVYGSRLLTNGGTDIIEFDDSTMVISSNGLSILNTNTQKFKYLDEGTPIASMALDNKHNLWFTYNTGVACRMLPNEELIYTFDARDGIGNTEFHTGAAITLRNGHIALGTSHDILEFDPASPLNFLIGKAKVHLSGIELGGKQLSVDSVLHLKALELSYKENSLSIFFTNNQFQNLQNIHYMVEGLDKNWKRLYTGSEVSLNYLPPGKYVVKATCLDESLQPGVITSITIIVAAPFYKTWWFYSLIGIAIAGLLYWFDKERNRRKEAIQLMRSNIANNLHQEVNTALNNINILSEMALIKSANEPEKATEFVQQIQSKSHNIIIAMDDMLWAIDPENDSMEKTMDRMQEYIEALNIRNGADIQMLVEGKVKILKLNMEFRHEAFTLFKESINSLVKAGALHCKIHVLYQKAILLFTIQFSNEGCDMQQLNNFMYRQDMQKRLSNIRASLNVKVHKSSSALDLKIQVS